MELGAVAARVPRAVPRAPPALCGLWRPRCSPPARRQRYQWFQSLAQRPVQPPARSASALKFRRLLRQILFLSSSYRLWKATSRPPGTVLNSRLMCSPFPVRIPSVGNILSPCRVQLRLRLRLRRPPMRRRKHRTRTLQGQALRVRRLRQARQIRPITRSAMRRWPFRRFLITCRIWRAVTPISRPSSLGFSLLTAPARTAGILALRSQAPA